MRAERTEPWIWIDGAIVPASEARVGVLDHGFLYGDSIYETVRTYGGRPFHLDDHLDRLERSADRVGLSLPRDRAGLAAVIAEVAAHAAPDDAGVRLMVTRGEGPLGIDPTLCPTPRLLAYGWRIPPGDHPQLATGVALTVSSIRRNPPSALDPAIKSGNFLNNILAIREARERGVADAILLTTEGHVAEGTTWNLFWVRGEEVRTGEDRGILLGVTRGLVLGLLDDLGVPAVRGAYPPGDLLDADEVFITSSLRGVIPVASIDEARFPVPGPITRRLVEAYRTLTDHTNRDPDRGGE